MGAGTLIYCYTCVWAEDEEKMRMKRGGRNRSRKEMDIKVKTWESGRFKTWSTTGPPR
jgi:hypothetical protein